MSGDGPFESIQDKLSAYLVETTRTAGQIASEDLRFLESSNPSVSKLLKTQNARLLSLARRLTAKAAESSEIIAPHLPNAEAIDDNWQSVVDVLDNLLEKADACLDEYTGVIKRLTPQRDTPVVGAIAQKARASKSLRHAELPKPQLLFNRLPSNAEVTSFKPLLRSKPHALIPLDDSIGPVIAENNFQEYKHPYETEILQSQYPQSIFEKKEPIPFEPFESTTATLVDTPEAVTAMLTELKQAKEIAIDLEHHDAHSYIGLVSLMQISTRNRDWIVDTLKPWREDLQILNEVFADPNIIKVFHGAFMDMIWLQRDLGLYVVGLFDTFHASRALGYAKRSLASLLSKFANFDAQKKYQMADWRIRPLPEEMFDYARSDTHFLLYIFDEMRNELIDQSDYSVADGNLIKTVQEDSKKESLQRYERPFYDTDRGMGATGWYNMLIKTPAIFTKEQFAIFRAVHQWRDQLARKEDESLNSVMPKTAVFNIAREMPTDMPALLGCSHPISTPVRQHIGELLGVIKRAKEAGTTGPDMKEFMRSHPATIEFEAERAVRVKAMHDRNINSVAQVLEAERQLQQVLPLREAQSNFWGSTIIGQKRKRTERLDQLVPIIQLAVPLPQLTAEIFSNGTTGIDTQEPIPEHAYTKERKPVENKVFIVKELGGRRKRKAAEAEAEVEEQSPLLDTGSADVEAEADSDEAAEAMEVSLPSVDEQAVLQRAEAKAARKVAKKAEKTRRGQAKVQRSEELGSGKEGEEEEALDYANAPSILNPKQDKGQQTASKTGFDPYRKSMDAPKGMRRLKKEIEGKSLTYKS